MKRYEKQEMLTALSGIASGLLIAMFVLTLLFLSGCSKTVYVPVENTVTRTDTVYQAKLRVDSVIFRDSVAVIQKGDTVYKTKYRDRFRYSERIDTVYQSVVDSVKVSVPFPVERKLSRWERVRQDAGGMAIGAAIVALCVAVLWLIRRYRK